MLEHAEGSLKRNFVIEHPIPGKSSQANFVETPSKIPSELVELGSDILVYCISIVTVFGNELTCPPTPLTPVEES